VISYNVVAKNLVAAGYQQGGEKHSSCLLVWDLNKVNKKSVKSTINLKLQESERGRLFKIHEAETVSEYKFQFKEINDDVNALVWVPNSACEMLAATEDSLIVCDTRQTWTISKEIDHGNNKKIYDIKFDPFNANQFATRSEDKIKIYDLRGSKKGPLVTLH
jgi:WD40 repeat protein